MQCVAGCQNRQEPNKLATMNGLTYDVRGLHHSLLLPADAHRENIVKMFTR